jgi:hypothetical protein
MRLRSSVRPQGRRGKRPSSGLAGWGDEERRRTSARSLSHKRACGSTLRKPRAHDSGKNHAHAGEEAKAKLAEHVIHSIRGSPRARLIYAQRVNILPCTRAFRDAAPGSVVSRCAQQSRRNESLRCLPNLQPSGGSWRFGGAFSDSEGLLRL